MLNGINIFTLIGRFDVNQYDDGTTKYYIIVDEQRIPITIAPGVPIEIFEPEDFIGIKGTIRMDNNVVLYVERMSLVSAHRKKE